MPWRPGETDRRLELESPFDDVPEHLYAPLLSWVDGQFYTASGTFRRDRVVEICLRLRRPQAEDPLHTFWALHQDAANDPEFLLTVTEALLNLMKFSEGREVGRLQALLSNANSLFTVREDGCGLEVRVAEGVREAVTESIARSESAGPHLTEAWNSAYGMAPDPTKSYSESIKAAEAALAPHVSPSSTRQTLSSMIRDIEAKPTKWKFTLTSDDRDPVAGVVLMMRLLWDGQAARHGSLGPSRAQTIEEARAAVHLAATLVQWGASGAIRRVD